MVMRMAANHKRRWGAPVDAEGEEGAKPEDAQNIGTTLAQVLHRRWVHLQPAAAVVPGQCSEQSDACL